MSITDKADVPFAKESGAQTSMPRLSLPLIVEGRYDKSAILGMVSGVVITTDGFGVFNSEQKRALIRRMSEGGILLLTDSDGGGKQIRSFISSLVPTDKLIHLYIPEIEGKEKRKTRRSAAGLLGVEGVGRDVLMRVLSPYLITDGESVTRSVGGITPADAYAVGISGGDCSQAARDRLCERLSLPTGMSVKAFLAAANLLISREEFLKIARC